MNESLRNKEGGRIENKIFNFYDLIMINNLNKKLIKFNNNKKNISNLLFVN